MEANEKKAESTISVEGGGASLPRGEKDRKGGERLRALFREMLFGVLYAIGGFLLGGAALPFGARPLGIALLAATDRKPLYVLAGLCLSTWRGEDRLLLISIYCAVFLVRLLTRFLLDIPWSEGEGAEMGEKTVGEVYPLLFSEHIALRMATSAVAVFAVGVYRLIEGGFLLYDLYGTILSLVVAPVAVLLFGGQFREGVKSEAYRLTGLLSLAFSLVYALGDRTLYGVSLSVLGCMLFTLYLTRKKGILAGMTAGTVVGIAVSAQLSPLFAFAALSSGMLFPYSSFLAAASAFSVGFAWSAYVEGLGILGGTLSALLVATFSFAVLDKLFFSAKEATAAAQTVADEGKSDVLCRPLESADLEGACLSLTHARIKELCEGMTALSESFREMGRNMRRPEEQNLRGICEEAMTSSCASCANRVLCWEEDFGKTSAAIGTLSVALGERGRITVEDTDEELRARCGRIYDILEEINYHASRHRRELLLGDRTELFALDYQGFSDLLSDTMARSVRSSEIDGGKSRLLSEGLSELSLGIRGACVWGEGRKVACLPQAPLSESEKASVQRKAEEICGFPLQEDCSFVREREQGLLLFCRKERVRVSYAVRSLSAKEEESFCGDTALTFRSREGKFYALISDGMGSGREAALTSALCGKFLDTLLSADHDPDTAFRMLNGFLRNRGGGSLHECSATVDLLEMDTVSGRASFHKSGAAPTYVLRSGGLLKLRSRTMPVGILEEPDRRTIRFSLEEGDVIVMVSDGVTGGKEECPWLYELLRGQSEDSSADRLADLIVKYAKDEGGSDDLSVVVVKVALA